jgi:hypothetical protein
MRKSTQKKIISVFIIFAFMGSSLTYAIIYAFPTENQQGTWAARISILIFGELQQIPAGVGIVDNETTQKVYTLDYDNIIYKDTDEQVTLGEFFNIWGENFNSTCILDYCNNENSSMVMYVNGVANTDYELYTIQNQDNIIIDYR